MYTIVSDHPLLALSAYLLYTNRINSFTPLVFRNSARRQGAALTMETSITSITTSTGYSSQSIWVGVQVIVTTFD